MKKIKKISITDYDYERLNEMLDVIEKDNTKDGYFIDELKKEIEDAEIVSSEDVVGEIVTMNSKVLLEDLNTQEEFSLKVVFPSEADFNAGQISVLAPVGTALLGYRVGDTISWRVPGGLRKLKIKKMLYQPEAEGDLYQ